MKKIIVLLICCIFFLIYIYNQGEFLNILLNPENTKYNLGEKYTGYLISNDATDDSLAKKIDNGTDFCVVFESFVSSKAFYTDECNQEYSYMKSQSMKFDKGKEISNNTMYYEPIYEYLYDIEEMQRIDTFESNTFSYNMIYFPKDREIVDFFPSDMNYQKISTMYRKYDSEWLLSRVNIQNKIIKVVTFVTILYIFYEYIVSIKKKYSIYQLLGVSGRELMLRMCLDYMFMISLTFAISFCIYAIIVVLNGNIIYIPKYFEYISLMTTIPLYIYIILLLIPLSILSFYIMEFQPLEKRIK